MVISKNKNYELEKLKDKRKFEDATWLKKMLTTREGIFLVILTVYDNVTTSFFKLF